MDAIEVGAGGQGRVTAEERPAGWARRRRLLAIKRVPPAGEPRLQREAAVLGALRSRHVPRVVGPAKRGELAMELVPGVDLQRLLQALGSLSLDVAAQVGVDVSRALQATHEHERAFVHRDVAPANVLVSDAGRVVLADYGLASARGARRLSGEHDVLGRCHYLAPEYWSTGDATAQADQYGLGVLLYRCLSGRLPYSGTAEEVADGAAAGAFVPLGEERPDLPPEVAHLVDALLDPAAGRRPCAREVIAALGPHTTVVARIKLGMWARSLSAPTRPRRGWWIVALAAAAWAVVTAAAAAF